MAVLTVETTGTRDQILDAADRLMSRFGFRKMTLDDVAREASLSKRTIYLHFTGKEDVGLSSIGRVVEAVHNSLQEISKRDQSEVDRLEQMLIVRVMGRIERIKDYYHSLDELFEVVRPAYMARRKTYFEKEVQLIAAVLEEGCRNKTFFLGDAQGTARALLLATNAFLPYSLSVRELGEPHSIEADLSAMVRLLLRGLTTEESK